jgi:hypothetical protein
MSVGNPWIWESRIGHDCFAQIGENAREAREHVRGASREENTHTNNKQKTNSWYGEVLKSGQQRLETADDDQLVPLLENAEQESVGDLCED